MIYVDTSALVKLIITEEHSTEYIYSPMAVSEIGAVELRRAVRLQRPDLLTDAEHLLARMTKVAVNRAVLQAAGGLQPASLRTLDAIHLASAVTMGDLLDAFVSYDQRLLEAARLAGLPTASPGL